MGVLPRPKKTLQSTPKPGMPQGYPHVHIMMWTEEFSSSTDASMPSAAHDFGPATMRALQMRDHRAPPSSYTTSMSALGVPGGGEKFMATKRWPDCRTSRPQALSLLRQNILWAPVGSDFHTRPSLGHEPRKQGRPSSPEARTPTWFAGEATLP